MSHRVNITVTTLPVTTRAVVKLDTNRTRPTTPSVTVRITTVIMLSVIFVIRNFTHEFVRLLSVKHCNTYKAVAI